MRAIVHHCQGAVIFVSESFTSRTSHLQLAPHLTHLLQHELSNPGILGAVKVMLSSLIQTEHWAQESTFSEEIRCEHFFCNTLPHAWGRRGQGGGHCTGNWLQWDSYKLRPLSVPCSVNYTVSLICCCVCSWTHRRQQSRRWGGCRSWAGRQSGRGRSSWRRLDSEGNTLWGESSSCRFSTDMQFWRLIYVCVSNLTIIIICGWGFIQMNHIHSFACMHSRLLSYHDSHV